MTNAAVELAVSMSVEPHRFILQALDPDHGSPVLEALFLVSEIEDLRALLSNARDDPELERWYTLDAAELAAINKRFGVAFDPEGRDLYLSSWSSIRNIPYLVHSGYELPLLLEARKQLAYFSEAYPPGLHWNEEKFDRYVVEGALHKEVVVEPFEQPIYREDGSVIEGLRTVYYARKGEEWRIPASKLIWDGATKSVWSDDFELLQGMLFGYEDWQNDWWIAHLRKRRRKFGCLSVCRAISAEELAWIETAGYRALPPTDSPILAVSLDDAARRTMESSSAVALAQFHVRSRPFLDLVDGQMGPSYAVPTERIKDLNRNIVGEIDIVARREAGGAWTFNCAIDPPD
jgi:hypothetical protein